jgi:hypothetical protein
MNEPDKKKEAMHPISTLAGINWGRASASYIGRNVLSVKLFE